MIIQKFGIYDKIYQKHEDAALKTYDPEFFSTAHLLKLAKEAQLSEENKKAITDFMEYAGDDIKKFMWLFYYILFKSEEDFTTDIWQIDESRLPSVCEEKYPGMLKACIYLAAAENLREWLSARKLKGSGEMLEAFFDRYRYFVNLNLISHHTVGFCRLSPFLYAYGKPIALKIGRLSYQLREFFDYHEVYEDENGKRIFAALPWRKYNSEGLIDANGKTPFYQQTGDILTPETTEVDLNKYKKILAPGDMVATIHIPGGGKLDPESVNRSLKDAKEILKREFPFVKAFVCRTWFIDPGLRSVFKEGANMLKFADMFDIISTEDNENHSLFEHIFETVPCDLSELVPKNDFQQKMLDRAKRGEKIYWSFGILKKEYEK